MTVTYEVVEQRLAFEAADVAAKKVADALLALVREVTPVDTGTLRDGWKLMWDEPSFVIYNEVRYARAVEYGSSHVPADGMMGRATALTKARYGLG